MCSRVSCGLEPSHVYDIRDSLDETSQNGYDFTCAPIVHPRYFREHQSGAALKRTGPFTRPDLLLTSSEWGSLIVGVLNKESCIGCDSNCRSTVTNSEESLLQELTLAGHLSMPAVMVTLSSDRCVNLARLIHNRVVSTFSYQVWVRVPMTAARDDALQFRSDMEGAKSISTDTWNWWHRFHSVANIEKKIGLCLEISADLPEKEIIDRWLGEPIKCTILPTDIWMTNKKGFPVLSPAHQNLVKKLFNLHSQFLITGNLKHGHVKYYQQYLDHVIQNTENSGDALIQYARGYEDYLQCPLQPLMDNLESQTYEVFEKDPIKYQEYERAIHDALLDRVPEEKKDDITVVIMVVGAGRGPLVRRAIVAASQADRNVKLYAVEKNPNAILTLHALKDMEWGDKVEVVSSDMREWNPPEKADILVSELLGSFGDNELSPECLDGAQKFLKEDGISIPEDYTSFIAPIQSPKLYNEIRSCREKDKHHLAHVESPYVVFLHNKREIAPSQELFTFKHPNHSKHIDNRRQASLQFKVSEDSVMHGIAGYFETTLYKTVKLSIRPETHSPGMFSWFPILFPIKEPIKVHRGEIIEINFWRCVTKKNVWYEWCVTDPIITQIHNPNGRSYTIGL